MFTYLNLIQTTNGIEFDITNAQSPAMIFDARDRYIDSFVIRGDRETVQKTLVRPIISDCVYNDIAPRNAARKAQKALKKYRIANPIAFDFIRRNAN